MAKSKAEQLASDKAATIQALVQERTAAEAEQRAWMGKRAEAEREARKHARRVAELNEAIAKAAIG
jgi:hypothetical protein